MHFTLDPRRRIALDIIAMILVAVILAGLMMYVHQGIQQYDDSTLTYMTTLGSERNKAKKDGVDLTETALERAEATIRAYPRIMIFLIAAFLVFSFWGIRANAHLQAPLCAIFLLLGIGCSTKVLYEGFPGLTGETGFLVIGCFVMAIMFFVWRKLGFDLSNKFYWILVALVTIMIIMNWVTIFKGNNAEDAEGVANGAANWFSLGGILIQPSEFIKAGLLILGSCCGHKKWRKYVYCLFCFISCFTVVKAHDFGTAFVIAAMFFGMVIILFDEEWLNAAMFTAGLVGFILLIGNSVHAIARFEEWGNAMSNLDHPQQRDFITAIIRGGWSGLGMEEASRYFVVYSGGSDGVLGSVQAIFGLPMLLLTITCYIVLVCACGFSRNVNRSTQPILLQMALMITAQVLLNYLGSLDVVPFTGIVCPLLSQGGTSTLAAMGLFGVMLAGLQSKTNVPTTYREVTE